MIYVFIILKKGSATLYYSDDERILSKLFFPRSVARGYVHDRHPLGCRGVLGQPTGDLARPCVDNDLRLPDYSSSRSIGLGGSVTFLGAAEIEMEMCIFIQFTPFLLSSAFM